MIRTISRSTSVSLISKLSKIKPRSHQYIILALKEHLYRFSTPTITPQKSSKDNTYRTLRPIDKLTHTLSIPNTLMPINTINRTHHVQIITTKLLEKNQSQLDIT